MMTQTTIAPFTFCQRDYTVLEDLVDAMGAGWNDGKALLFGGSLKDHTRKTNPSFSAACAAAEKEYQADAAAGSRIYLKWLSRYPGIRALYWQGHRYGGVKDIASALCGHDETLENLMLHMMKEQYLSTFVRNTGGGDELTGQIRFLEKGFGKSNSRFAKRNALPILRYLLSGEKSFVFGAQSFRTPADLAAHLQPYADMSKSALSRAVQPLFQDDCNLDPMFEAWIIANGYHHELTLWKSRFQEGDGAPDDAEDYLPEDEQIQAAQAHSQPDDVFSESLDGFEDRFREMLMKYPDCVDDPAAFSALMNDCFPTAPLQCYLLKTLQRMDIVRTLRDAGEAAGSMTARFERRLVQDFGVKETFARWAVGVWVRCCGRAVLDDGSTPA